MSILRISDVSVHENLVTKGKVLRKQIDVVCLQRK